LNTSKLKSKSKTFLAINFGCRVNAAETNLWSQILIEKGFLPAKNCDLPSIILINTCSVTKKGEKESINKIKFFHKKYPYSKIIVSGCADFKKIKSLENISVFSNSQKEKIIKKLSSSYSPKIKDKFSNTNRFLLKIQSGCTQFCSYCIVPFKRNYLYSLPITKAIKTVNQAINNGYKEIIITGVNIDQYQYDLSLLIKMILDETKIKLISFGSIPINCLTKDFINLYKHPEYKSRLSHFLHIPIQSGSNKILKLMNRPYTQKDIITKFTNLKSNIVNLKFGTDIIVGFPTETNKDFQQTLTLCQKISFSKIHVFKFSPRPNTAARILFENSPKISKETVKFRSQQISQLQLKN
jgi:threonylcarbamoyladenosine tRNA methylthiotransferase MtaB